MGKFLFEVDSRENYHVRHSKKKAIHLSIHESGNQICWCSDMGLPNLQNCKK
jgi:hypothetical protein